MYNGPFYSKLYTKNHFGPWCTSMCAYGSKTYKCWSNFFDEKISLISHSFFYVSSMSTPGPHSARESSEKSQHWGSADMQRGRILPYQWTTAYEVVWTHGDWNHFIQWKVGYVDRYFRQSLSFCSKTYSQDVDVITWVFSYRSLHPLWGSYLLIAQREGIRGTTQ